MSSTVARRFNSVPVRSAAATWEAIIALLAPDPRSAARSELRSVGAVASTLIAEKAMEGAPIVVTGSGPRVRVYCLYDERAIEGDGASEDALAFDATAGDWSLSLPCPEADLGWVRALLRKNTSSGRVTARDLREGIALPDEGGRARGEPVEIDEEAFLRDE